MCLRRGAFALSVLAAQNVDFGILCRKIRHEYSDCRFYSPLNFLRFCACCLASSRLATPQARLAL